MKFVLRTLRMHNSLLICLKFYVNIGTQPFCAYKLLINEAPGGSRNKEDGKKEFDIKETTVAKDVISQLS